MTRKVLKPEGDSIVESEQPALLALNETLRDAYIADCERAMVRWNKIIREAGVDFELKLPHRGFHRAIGEFRDANVTPDGRDHRAGRMADASIAVAADTGRSGFRRIADEAGDAARQIRRMDRAADSWD